MKDTKYNHSGIYLGNGKVFEDTTGWGVKRAVISDISDTGVRSLKGKRNLKWTYHGMLKYIDYSNYAEDKKKLVKDLQKKLNQEWHTNLDIDGIFGPKTKKVCDEHYLHLKIKAPIMVKWLQKRLCDLGYSVGKYGIDGIFGSDTLKAVKHFQKDYGLDVDGDVGSKTCFALTS